MPNHLLHYLEGAGSKATPTEIIHRLYLLTVPAVVSPGPQRVRSASYLQGLADQADGDWACRGGERWCGQVLAQGHMHGAAQDRGHEAGGKGAANRSTRLAGDLTITRALGTAGYSFASPYLCYRPALGFSVPYPPGQPLTWTGGQGSGPSPARRSSPRKLTGNTCQACQ